MKEEATQHSGSSLYSPFKARGTGRDGICCPRRDEPAAWHMEPRHIGLLRGIERLTRPASTARLHAALKIAVVCPMMLNTCRSIGTRSPAEIRRSPTRQITDQFCRLATDDVKLDSRSTVLRSAIDDTWSLQQGRGSQYV